jgi:hypothetical protein
LTQAAQELVPGQEIDGRAAWQLDDAPKRASLRLFWYTEGRGNQDVGIVAEEEFDPIRASHDEEYRFTIPESPYSFSGKLISLRWAIELVIDKGKEVERIELMVSPWVEEVKLGTIEKEKKNRFFSVSKT